MENLMLFKNEMFGEVRVVMMDNKEWFVAKDVVNCLGYDTSVNSYSKYVLKFVDSDDNLKCDSQLSFGIDYKQLGQRGGLLINESGLYSLILSSKLECAKQFKKWVTSEILPSIRKHGVYATPKTLENMLRDPDSMITILQTLKQERLEKEIAIKQKSEIQTTLNCVVEQGITIDKFNQLFNKIIRKVAEVKFNNNYASAYNHFYDFLNYKIEINIRLRKTNAVKKLTCEYIKNGKSVPKTLSKKVTLTSVIKEHEYDQVIKTLKCWAVDLGVDIVNIDKL